MMTQQELENILAEKCREFNAPLQIGGVMPSAVAQAALAAMREVEARVDAEMKRIRLASVGK